MLQGRVFVKIGIAPFHIAFVDTIVLNDKYPIFKNNSHKKSLNLSKDSIHEDSLDKQLKAYVINNNNNNNNNNNKQLNQNENQNRIQSINKIDNNDSDDNKIINDNKNEDKNDNKNVNKIIETEEK